jgi:hypothetical protein
MAGPAGLMCAGDRWRVDSLLRCSLDVSVAVTDASLSEVRIFILLPLNGAQTNGHCSYRGEH